MRARAPWFVALALGLSVLAIWRAACLNAGPDLDTDAYAHHMIARAILADPRDLAVHWVWLPLFHYLQVPLVACGGTIQAVRWANVVLAAALPVVLFAYVLGTARPRPPQDPTVMPPAATALLAALFSAMCPIAMQMGTTAQPEPLFALLVLLVAIAFEKRRYALGSLFLGAAVMLRYEAWAVLGAVWAALALELVRTRARSASSGVAEPSGRVPGWAMVALPTALILAWAALRRPVDGQWFGFLRQTHEFANDALHEKSALDRGLLGLVKDAFYYPIIVPARVLGAAALFVPFGVVRTVRQQGSRFVLVFAACLGFVSLTWILRASLGLDRHFVCVAPLYATFAAQGIAWLSERAAQYARRFGLFARQAVAVGLGRWLALALALLSLGGLAVELTVWMGYWRASIERGWPERVALGAYLRALPESATIFCDDATLEILSGLDRRRFDRHWVDDSHTWDLVADAAREQGVAYVATWRRKLRGHDRASRDPADPEVVTGTVVFHEGFDPRDVDTTGVAVMRVTADERSVPR